LLAATVHGLLADPALREAYAAAAVDRVRARYSWDRIASDTVGVYDRVVPQPARAERNIAVGEA
jgi:glycosyltransferase involved in cell wall biosynthesis